MTRILGVGSPFGADRLAWDAIDHLSGLGLEGCELVKLDRPGSGLLAYFEEIDNLILLDAVALDADPGRVSRLDRASLQRLSPGNSSHGFGVVQALELAEQLGQMPANLHILGIHTGEDLSLLPRLDTETLERLINSLLQ